MSDLFNSPDAIVVLNDGETYTNMNGCYVYILDESIDDSDYDISTFAQEVVDKPGVQILSIERLVEFYLAFQSMHAHAYNVPVIISNGDPTDVGGMPEIGESYNLDDTNTGEW
jgi:hypothetical protein